jgi:CubicO group peptidase (beta-lactamase class C family)
MTPTSPSRRDVLKGAAAITAAASVGLGEAFTARRAHAQGGATQSRARIDSVLNQAVDAKEVPGVVAMAATDKGRLYEGAFGARDLGKGPDMTPDTFFRIASMTKAITCTAALQLVEQGKPKVDDPVPAIDPALSSPQVLDGFDAAGAPILRAVKRPITLRHLMTHTAGFSYEVWDGNTQRYVKASGMPSTATGKVAALRMPLVFDPGDKWEYGVNIDWVGRIVESISGQPIDAYFKDRIFGPLNMKDTGFVSSSEQRRAPGQRAPAPGRRHARAAAARDALRAGVLRGRGRALLHRQRLPVVPPDAAQRRQLQRGANPEAGDGRADGAQPHR